MPEQKTTARIALNVLPGTSTLRSDGFVVRWRSIMPGPSFRFVTIENAPSRLKVLAVQGKRFAHGGERLTTSGQRIGRRHQVLHTAADFPANSMS
jgi:hypothetical protein